MSWSRFRRLLVALPATSRTSTAVRGEAAWSLTDQLLASILDQLRILSWQTARNKRAPKPTPVPRPGVGPQRLGRGAVSREEMAQIQRNWGRGMRDKHARRS